MRSVLYAGVAAGALLVGSAAPSYAMLMLQVSDGVPADAVSLSDTLDTGAVNFVGSIGAFSFNVITGTSTPLIGTLTQPILDLNSIDVSAPHGGGTLTFQLTDTDYVGVGGPVHFEESVGGTLSAGSYSVSSFMDCGDTAFAQTTALTSQAFSGPAFSASQGGTTTACSGNYSLTQLAVLTLPGGAIFSGDSSLSIPEPSTLALFGGVGLLGLAFGWRRKYLTISTDSGPTAA